MKTPLVGGDRGFPGSAFFSHVEDMRTAVCAELHSLEGEMETAPAVTVEVGCRGTLDLSGFVWIRAALDDLDGLLEAWDGCGRAMD
jgi:hypothetical protein